MAGAEPDPAKDPGELFTSEFAVEGAMPTVKVKISEAFGTKDVQTLTMNDFVFIAKLGFGHQAIVRLARYIPTGDLYAIKSMDKLDLYERHLEKSINEEMYNLRKCNGHPFIVDLLACVMDKTHCHLIMEFLQGGDLGAIIEEASLLGSGMDVDASLVLGAEILLGIREIHKFGIVFRDLHPENIMLDAGGHANIIDFGSSYRFQMGEKRTRTQCGIMDYVAPEVWQNRGYGKEVDLWSFGVLLFEMLCGYLPFIETDHAYLAEIVMRGTIDWPTWLTPNHKIRTLIEGLLDGDPSKRWDPAECMQAEVFLRMKWGAINTNMHGPGAYQQKFRDETDCGCFDWNDVTSLPAPTRALKLSEEAAWHTLPLFVSKTREHKDHKVHDWSVNTLDLSSERSVTFGAETQGTPLGLGLQEESGRVVIFGMRPGSLSTQPQYADKIPLNVNVKALYGKDGRQKLTLGRPLHEITDMMRDIGRPLTITFEDETYWKDPVRLEKDNVDQITITGFGKIGLQVHAESGVVAVTAVSKSGLLFKDKDKVKHGSPLFGIVGQHGIANFGMHSSTTGVYKTLKAASRPVTLEFNHGDRAIWNPAMAEQAASARYGQGAARKFDTSTMLMAVQHESTPHSGNFTFHVFEPLGLIFGMEADDDLILCDIMKGSLAERVYKKSLKPGLRLAEIQDPGGNLILANVQVEDRLQEAYDFIAKAKRPIILTFQHQSALEAVMHPFHHVKKEKQAEDKEFANKDVFKTDIMLLNGLSYVLVFLSLVLLLLAAWSEASGAAGNSFNVMVVGVAVVTMILGLLAIVGWKAVEEKSNPNILFTFVVLLGGSLVMILFCLLFLIFHFDETKENVKMSMKQNWVTWWNDLPQVVIESHNDTCGCCHADRFTDSCWNTFEAEYVTTTSLYATGAMMFVLFTIMAVLLRSSVNVVGLDVVVHRTQAVLDAVFGLAGIAMLTVALFAMKGVAIVSKAADTSVGQNLLVVICVVGALMLLAAAWGMYFVFAKNHRTSAFATADMYFLGLMSIFFLSTAMYLLFLEANVIAELKLQITKDDLSMFKADFESAMNCNDPAHKGDTTLMKTCKDAAEGFAEEKFFKELSYYIDRLAWCILFIFVLVTMHFSTMLYIRIHGAGTLNHRTRDSIMHERGIVKPLGLRKARIARAALASRKLQSTGLSADGVAAIDKDGDGILSTENIREALRSMGHNLTDAEVLEIKAAVDTDHDGTVTVEEFLAGARDAKNSHQQSTKSTQAKASMKTKIGAKLDRDPVVIDSVTHGGAGSMAGLAQGNVLLTVSNDSVLGTWADDCMTNMAKSFEADGKYTLQVARDWDVYQACKAAISRQEETRLEVTVSLSEDLASSGMQLTENNDGVLQISSIDADSIAEKSGLFVGMLLRMLDGMPVTHVPSKSILSRIEKDISNESTMTM